MASSYALPTGSEAGQHTHSHSNAYRTPSDAPAGLGINSNAYTKNNLSTHSLHHHSSHDELNDRQEISTPSKSKGLASTLPSLGKSRTRARGESDLGRPPSIKGNAYRPTLSDLPSASTSSLGQEVLTALLLCLPLFAAALGIRSVCGSSWQSTAAVLRRRQTERAGIDLQHLKDDIMHVDEFSTRGSQLVSCGVVEALLLSSAMLLVAAVVPHFTRTREQTTRSSHASPRIPSNKKSDVKPVENGFDYSIVQTIGIRCLSIFLPLFAAVKLGGWRSSLIILAAHTAELTSSEYNPALAQRHASQAVMSNIGLCAVLAIAFVTDFLQITSQAASTDAVLGYAAMISAVLFTPSPFNTKAIPTLTASKSGTSTPVSPNPAPWRSKPLSRTSSLRPKTTGAVGGHALSIDLSAGLTLSIITTVLLIVTGSIPPLSAAFIVGGTVSVLSTVAAIQFAKPAVLQSSQKGGFLVGVLILALLKILTSEHFWPDAFSNIFLSGLVLTAVLLDNRPTKHTHTEHVHENGSVNKHQHQHQHHHQHSSVEKHSKITSALLAQLPPDSLMHTILSEKDSRRIAYFTCLNFAFMLVQGLYGYLSGSLGLLSDTVHMFFDCLGLIVGLGAAVASKWPPSRERPFGWGKLNTLAGFGNGVFLMLVSVEFVWEAIEGILEGRELRRVKELFVVSTLGLLVNLVGLFAFGHAHAGHDHGHSHSHDHKHEANGEQDSHHHGHAHNENMHGIFLHVAADAGGSLAVIISTAATIYQPWYLWDPLATIIIAVLIFAAAVPLVVSSGQKLLLIVPEETEYAIKNFLQEVGEVRGVLAYAAPRFWTLDEVDAHVHHEHKHGHGGDHEHKHEHSADTKHSHDAHSLEHNHDSNAHEHDHSYDVHDPSHDHAHHMEAYPTPTLTGCLHVTTVPFADLEDVRERIEELAMSRGMQLVIHVEYDGDTQCWCGGSQKS